MKLERLLSIVILLMNRRIVQAKELADLFEVSIRTIYRDIESINQAGIPIVTHQGANGGISLVEGYRLDRNVLTNTELISIVTALQSISTSHENSTNRMLLEKINSVIPATEAEEFQIKTKQFIVDFASWSKNPQLEEKIKRLRHAVEKQHPIRFTYHNAQGDITQRFVDPYTLVLKRHSWYLYAFCRDKMQFRLFKLIRIKDLSIEKETFARQDISLEDSPWQKQWNSPSNQQKLALRFHSSVKQLAEEWFGVEKLSKDNAGKYIVSAEFPEDNWLYGFILSFGEGVEVLEPDHIRQKIKTIAENVVNLYKK